MYLFYDRHTIDLEITYEHPMFRKLKKKDWKHLEKDVKIEEQYLAELFHDKHDYSHYMQTDITHHPE